MWRSITLTTREDRPVDEDMLLRLVQLNHEILRQVAPRLRMIFEDQKGTRLWSIDSVVRADRPPVPTNLLLWVKDGEVRPDEPINPPDFIDAWRLPNRLREEQAVDLGEQPWSDALLEEPAPLRAQGGMPQDMARPPSPREQRAADADRVARAIQEQQLADARARDRARLYTSVTTNTATSNLPFTELDGDDDDDDQDEED
jgi:hypothetical protein